MSVYEREERVRGWSVSRNREEVITGCTSNKYCNNVTDNNSDIDYEFLLKFL